VWLPQSPVLPVCSPITPKKTSNLLTKRCRETKISETFPSTGTTAIPILTLRSKVKDQAYKMPKTFRRYTFLASTQPDPTYRGRRLHKLRQAMLNPTIKISE